MLHRDISPKNIMIKEYDDVKVVKVCDFGLVKLPESDMTSIDSTRKGAYNDPALDNEGFGNYSIVHETYALTNLVAFTMTGSIEVNRIANAMLKSFVQRGLSVDKSKRFQSVNEMIEEFKKSIPRHFILNSPHVIEGC